MARKPAQAPVTAINFSVWAKNGDPMPEEARQAIEAAIELAILQLHFDGCDLLTQTTYAR